MVPVHMDVFTVIKTTNNNHHLCVGNVTSLVFLLVNCLLLELIQISERAD
jgi:hypothetical protein